MSHVLRDKLAGNFVLRSGFCGPTGGRRRAAARAKPDTSITLLKRETRPPPDDAVASDSEDRADDLVLPPEELQFDLALVQEMETDRELWSR